MWHRSVQDLQAPPGAGASPAAALRFVSDDGGEILVTRFGREHQLTFTYRRDGVSTELTGSQCDAYGEAPSQVFTVVLADRPQRDEVAFRTRLKADLLAAFAGTRFFADFPLIDNVAFC